MPCRPSLASPTTSNSGVVQGFAYDGHGVELALEGQAARCAGLPDLRRDALHLAKLSHVALHPDAKRFSGLRSGVEIEDGVARSPGGVLHRLGDLRGDLPRGSRAVGTLQRALQCSRLDAEEEQSLGHAVVQFTG